MTAVSVDGKDRWRTVVNADKPVQKVVLIELQKVRAAREKDEKEAAQLKKDIEAKQDQTKRLRSETANAAVLQQAVNSRKAEIQDQIAALQKQGQQEQAAAQDDEANAQQARSCVASQPKTTAGSLLAAACTLKAIESDNSVRTHRANGVNLLNQISDLTRQLTRPDGGLPIGFPKSSLRQPSAIGLEPASATNSRPPGPQQSFNPVIPTGPSVASGTTVPAMIGPAGSQRQFITSRGATLATDMDCLVAIDGRIVGRIQKDGRGFFPASQGMHTFSAATQTGDYWNKRVEIMDTTNLSLVISFQKMRADQVVLQEKTPERASLELQAARRRSIVKATKYYADQWGKELGMQQNRDKSGGALDDAVSALGSQNLGNLDAASQTPNNLAMGIEILRANYLKTKARKNELAAHAAEMQVDYLGKAMEEPLRYPPADDSKGYAAIIRAVTRDKEEGKLITSPDSIEYQDSRGVKEHISCSSLTGASAGSHVHLQYTVDLAGDHKLQKKSLNIQAVPESDQDLIMGNVYLACPKLTQ